MTLELSGLTRRFAGRAVVDGLSLRLGRGELLALLGPSGCGKTTTLRMVAGHERPDAGAVRLEGEDVTALPPEGRDIGMVFQSYALFPHLSVFGNVAFGLRCRKVSREEERSRVADALALVGLAGRGRDRVTRLSGGEQQRVALARALVLRPRLLLLDEPLSNLDAELRYATRSELADLQSRLSITAVYVTHDQEEALELAHRIAVLKDGTCHQVGTPQQILDDPATSFVETFLERQRRDRAPT